MTFIYHSHTSIYHIYVIFSGFFFLQNELDSFTKHNIKTYNINHQHETLPILIFSKAKAKSDKKKKKKK